MRSLFYAGSIFLHATLLAVLIPQQAAGLAIPRYDAAALDAPLLRRADEEVEDGLSYSGKSLNIIRARALGLGATAPELRELPDLARSRRYTQQHSASNTHQMSQQAPGFQQAPGSQQASNFYPSQNQEYGVRYGNVPSPKSKNEQFPDLESEKTGGKRKAEDPLEREYKSRVGSRPKAE